MSKKKVAITELLDLFTQKQREKCNIQATTYIMKENFMCYVTEIAHEPEMDICSSVLQIPAVCYVTFVSFITLSLGFLPGVSDFGSFLVA
jgi:hypothetical protein